VVYYQYALIVKINQHMRKMGEGVIVWWDMREIKVNDL
jgi:hypothetical protein